VDEHEFTNFFDVKYKVPRGSQPVFHGFPHGYGIFHLALSVIRWLRTTKDHQAPLGGAASCRPSFPFQSCCSEWCEKAPRFADFGVSEEMAILGKRMINKLKPKQPQALMVPVQSKWSAFHAFKLNRDWYTWIYYIIYMVTWYISVLTCQFHKRSASMECGATISHNVCTFSFACHSEVQMLNWASICQSEISCKCLKSKDTMGIPK